MGLEWKSGEKVSVLKSYKHKYKVSHRHSRRLINQMEQRDCSPSWWYHIGQSHMQRKWRIIWDRGTSRWVNSTLGEGWPWSWGELCNEGWDPEGHCDSRECEHQILTLRLQQHKLNGCWKNPYYLRPSAGLQRGSRETWVDKCLFGNHS